MNKQSQFWVNRLVKLSTDPVDYEAMYGPTVRGHQGSFSVGPSGGGGRSGGSRRSGGGNGGQVALPPVDDSWGGDMVFSEEEAGVVPRFGMAPDYRVPSFGHQLGTGGAIQTAQGTIVPGQQVPRQRSQVVGLSPGDWSGDVTFADSEVGMTPRYEMAPDYRVPSFGHRLGTGGALQTAQGTITPGQQAPVPAPAPAPAPQVAQAPVPRPSQRPSSPIPEGYGRPQPSQPRPSQRPPSRPRPSTRESK